MAVLKPGTRMRSAVCKTEVMVIAAPGDDIELSCGGAPMIGNTESPTDGASPAAGADGGTLLGKRYVNAAATVELLCVKPGDGSLSIGGEALVLKEAKPLPSSD